MYCRAAEVCSSYLSTAVVNQNVRRMCRKLQARRSDNPFVGVFKSFVDVSANKVRSHKSMMDYLLRALILLSVL